MTENEQLLTRVAAHAAELRPWPDKPLPEPATAEDVARAEAALGFALPPLLAALYTRIADGGFGPEYGLLCLDDAVAVYRAHRRQDEGEGDAEWPWPEGVLPMADCGCAMLACVDSRSEEARVLLFEPNPGEVDRAWYVLDPSIAGWLTAWLDGTGWFADQDEEFDGDLAPWPDFRVRI